MTLFFTAYDKSAELDSDAYEGYPLVAKTDEAARKEAKKLASEKNWGEVAITFYRDTDQCRGEIDA